MRSTRWMCCAAAAANSTSTVASSKPLASGAGGSGDNRGSKGINTAAVATALAFRRLPIHPWQLHAIQLPHAAARSSSGSHATGAPTEQCVTTADRMSCLPPTAVLYHGAKLGPRPLIILDHSLPAVQATGRGDVRASVAAALAKDFPVSPDAMRAAAKYEALLCHLRWAHGAVYIPVHAAAPSSPATATQPNVSMVKAAEADSLMDTSCRQVLAVLDVLGVHWAHFLTYGYGTLVAARLAASCGAANRIGTLLSLDTPLVTASMVRNHAAREELRAAKRDVNIPAAEIAFATETLLEGLEEPLPCPAEELATAAAAAAAAVASSGEKSITTATTAFDPTLAANEVALYKNYLFDPAATFAEGGVVRNESRYTPIRALAEVQHPIQLILPAKGAVCDVVPHRELFGLRRPVVIKSAGSHAALFGLDNHHRNEKKAADEGRKAKLGAAEKAESSTSAADAVREVAHVIGAWLDRFEQDTVLARRYAQAAKEMTTLMGGKADGAGGVGDGAGGNGKQKSKKKEKKKG